MQLIERRTPHQLWHYNSANRDDFRDLSFFLFGSQYAFPIPIPGLSAPKWQVSFQVLLYLSSNRTRILLFQWLQLFLVACEKIFCQNFYKISCPLLIMDECLVIASKQKAELFANYCFTNFTMNPPTDLTHPSPNMLYPHSNALLNTSEKFFRTFILKKISWLGWYSLHCFILKNRGPQLASILTRLFLIHFF